MHPIRIIRSGADRGWRLRLAACLLALLALPALAASGIPDTAWQYRRLLIRASLAEFGDDLSGSVFGPQIQQESGWRAEARSKYAAGPAQFTPATSDWFSRTIGRDLGPPRMEDYGWALPAMVRYDAWLYDRSAAATQCDRIAITLAKYNGGDGWIEGTKTIRGDRQIAADAGADPMRWWGNVERYSARADWAFRENRGYPRRILLELAPRYLVAGWTGDDICK